MTPQNHRSGTETQKSPRRELLCVSVEFCGICGVHGLFPQPVRPLSLQPRAKYKSKSGIDKITSRSILPHSDETLDAVLSCENDRCGFQCGSPAARGGSSALPRQHLDLSSGVSLSGVPHPRGIRRHPINATDRHRPATPDCLLRAAFIRRSASQSAGPP